MKKRRAKKIRIAGALIVFAILGLPAQKAFPVEPDAMKAPRVVIRNRVLSMENRADAPSPSVLKKQSALKGAIRLFQKTASKVDGSRCPMHPTCSHYSVQAMSKHGSIVGLMMTIDRLFHEWSEIETALKVRISGVRRYWDPLEANDFWFSKDDPAISASRPGGAP